ncbi:MAG: DegT/DnrJ/EryC1/StrS family aminotransferase [Candidatus Omnitrophica bacterium]|nr:DegT/DnrJ/EryC1/StrS family aminotransferase [Candidatus Omnitrophota bacterium]MBU1925323.1 DegT/DnrJ/EryC1/StrS family aminotransferase [Candidatus Omnitrophota bacterium]
MKIPFIDLNIQDKRIRIELKKKVARVLDSNDFILGAEVRCFESEFAAYCQSKFAVGLNSGTDALFLSLLHFNIGPGDEVICPAYSYIATALCISYTGAKPVFVDIDEKTYNINLGQIQEKINKRTKAIIVVHLYGQAADMVEICRIARKYNLKVIEDAAQAHGAELKDIHGAWRKAGTFGDVGCFSFYPTKNLGAAGDGGMVVTDNKYTFQKLLSLRDQGRRGKERYLHWIKGYNSRLDSIQAAILRGKMKFLDKWNKSRRRWAHLYSQKLSGIDGVTIPYEAPNKRHIFHIYALRIRKRRDDVCRALFKKGVHAATIYNVPLHLQPVYKELGYRRGDFPVAEKVCKEILCLPMYASLEEKQINFVIETFKQIFEQ